MNGIMIYVYYIVSSSPKETSEMRIFIGNFLCAKKNTLSTETYSGLDLLFFQLGSKLPAMMGKKCV